MRKKYLIFVCLGNICRSPSAEGVMKDMIKKEDLGDKIFVDSAGTIAYHSGEGADPRMIRHAKQRGYDLSSIARKFDPNSDFEKFDYIVTMDDENFADVLAMDIENSYTNKIFKMASFASDENITEVPDPYYGGSKGFEEVLDILEDTCKGLLERIKNDIQREHQKQN